MKIEITPAARTDIIRQFRHYLVSEDVPHIAFRFEAAVIASVSQLAKHPMLGKPTSVRAKTPVRRWPVDGFEQMLIYYRVDANALLILRLLHGKRKTPHFM